MPPPLLLTLLLILLLPSLLLAGPPSTLAIARAGNQTLICALLRDDALNCTAFPSLHTRSYPAANLFFSSLAAGDSFLCAASSSFSSPSSPSIMRWWEFPDSPSGGRRISVKRLYKGSSLHRLVAGDSHVCALVGEEEREPHCWRWPELKLPEKKKNKFLDIAVGGEVLCLLSSIGEIKCYGNSSSGIVGKEPGGSHTVIAAGTDQACGIRVNGSVSCWGDGAEKALPDGVFTAVAVGRSRACGVRLTGITVCWGSDNSFVLPERLANEELSAVEAKGDVFCGVLKRNYTVMCWGSETFDRSGSVVYDKVLPRPCVRSCPADYGLMDGSGEMCPLGTFMCEHRIIIAKPEAEPPPPPPPQAGPPTVGPAPASSSNKRLVYMVVGTVGLGVAGSIVLALVSYMFFKEKCCRCQRVHDSGPLEDLPVGGLPKPREMPSLDRRLSELINQGHTSSIEEFSFEALLAITRNFSEEKKIGSGSFGSVYRAVLDDGREVAIKRAELKPSSSSGSRQAGFRFNKEHAFLSELALLSRVNHRNLVRLLGFCRESNELVLVYDYMHNATLHDHLHKFPNSPLSSWEKRLTVALDAARGIEYLHRYAVPGIIHRDIKSSNILLDSTWTAKVADFGLCLIGPEDENSHISLRAAGTVGYMDPEYYRTQCLTTKSDVYSFGVVLLELITGCKAVHRDQIAGSSLISTSDPCNVVDFAVPHIDNDDFQNVLDPKLPPPRPLEIEAVQQLGYLAADCVRREGRDRPDMSEVVCGLEIALDAYAGPPLVRSVTTHSV